MSEPLEQMMTRLRQEYLAEVPTRLAELRTALAGFMGSAAVPGPPLATLFHRLAGSAGAYGFSAVTRTCREMEAFLAENPPPSVVTHTTVETALSAIERAYARGPTE